MGRFAYQIYSLILLLLFGASSWAQTTSYTFKPPCLPSTDAKNLYSGEPVMEWNTWGVCIRWTCLSPDSPKIVRPTYCGTWAQMNLVGSRLQTIQRATDPLTSLGNAGNRFPMVPLTDPSMEARPRFAPLRNPTDLSRN